MAETIRAHWMADVTSVRGRSHDGRVSTTLLGQAQQQYGFLTPEDARDAGVDPAQLRLMVARHTLERRGWGLHRMPTVPPTHLDAYMEAVLWTGRRGALSHETALDLYDLCDVNPSAIHLTVPRDFRTRKSPPAAYRLHRADVDGTDLRWHESIPIVSARCAIKPTRPVSRRGASKAG